MRIPLSKFTTLITNDIFRLGSDVLNRLVLCYETKGVPAKYASQGGDNLAADARHLSKYIFARQYGLNTPFSSTVKGPSINDCLDRDLEIQVRHLPQSFPAFFSSKASLLRQWGVVKRLKG